MAEELVNLPVCQQADRMQQVAACYRKQSNLNQSPWAGCPGYPEGLKAFDSGQQTAEEREMNETEYAADKARLALELATSAAEEMATLAIVNRIRDRILEAHAAHRLKIQIAQQDLDQHWLEIQEHSARCSKCGDRRNFHDPTDPEYNIHIYLTQCREFVPYEAATTPPSVTRRMRSTQAKQRTREAFWAQNAPKPPKGDK